jgi:uncharacterized protein (TIGR03792 family)
LGVPAGAYGAWLEAEKASWEPWLAKQPGFLDRQLLWDRQRQEGTLLIRWASRAQWKAIPAAEVDRVQERFESLARQFTGQASGKRNRKASNQRRKLSVLGGMDSLTSRPTTALPAHSSGGTVNSSAVMGESF